MGSRDKVVISVRGDVFRRICEEGSFMIFEYKGLRCVIMRMGLGFLNGYVAVPRGHPLFGKDYDDPVVSRFQVHGGITFAGYLAGYMLSDKDDLWWFGFDGAHAGDYVPFAGSCMERSIYRDMEYMRVQVIGLVEQLLGYERMMVEVGSDMD